MFAWFSLACCMARALARSGRRLIVSLLAIGPGPLRGLGRTSLKFFHPTTIPSKRSGHVPPRRRALMPAPLFSPPPTYSLPLTLSQDLQIDFMRTVSGAYTDYDAGTTVTLIIDTSPVTTVAATVSGHDAVVFLPSSVTDTIASGIPWRCLVSLTSGGSTTTLVAVQGRTARFDS